MRAWLFIFFLTSLVAHGKAKPPDPHRPPNWVLAARNLIGESDGRREKSLQYLKSLPDLEKIIEQELDGPHRYHALDVVAAIADPEFVPILQRKIFEDTDGFITLTLNALKTNDNKNELAKYYIVILSQSDHRARLSPPSICAMVDNLGRLGYKIPYDVFIQLLDHSSQEVKESSVAYMRTLALRYRNFEYLKSAQEILSTQGPQLRIQTLFALAEIPTNEFTSKINFVEICEKDADPEVKGICKSLKSQSVKRAEVAN